jgi:hypothetical protein
MKRLRLLTLVALVTSACVPTSISPVGTSTPDPTVVHDFLGTWKLAKFQGQTISGTLTVSIAQNAKGEVTATYSDEKKSARISVWVLKLPTTTVVSLSGENGLWNIVAVSVDKNGQELTAAGMNPARVRTDVGKGVLEGEVLEERSGLAITHLKASSERLASYLKAQPDVFTEASLALFTRVSK